MKKIDKIFPAYIKNSRGTVLKRTEFNDTDSFAVYRSVCNDNKHLSYTKAFWDGTRYRTFNSQGIFTGSGDKLTPSSPDELVSSNLIFVDNEESTDFFKQVMADLPNVSRLVYADYTPFEGMCRKRISAIIYKVKNCKDKNESND